MERKTKRISTVKIAAIVLGLTSAVVLGCFFLFVSMSSSVSGTASLPNGTTARINGPFSCSANTPTTEIEAGWHMFAFSPTTISIDGVPIRPLDATVTDVQIDASFWTASLKINGAEVPLVR